jgi:hypothetical protein
MSALELSARAFELPNNRPALIETDKMEAILTEIDAVLTVGGADFLRRGAYPRESSPSFALGGQHFWEHFFSHFSLARCDFPRHPISLKLVAWVIVSQVMAA